MSKEIDNKVVSLEFDNSKFDEPAKESMSTLDKLKASFNFKGVSKGFDTLNAAIRKVTFQPIESGIDTVYAKFTMMERFTIQLYDRMANAIINTGKKIVNETFVTPIRSGKSEYEEKMGSVQTIMAATGETLDTVNEKLNELNKYADDTIYSFRDMTQNIGKFTNAGVKLEDAVAAIKGISNEAALSGATANEASRAMYNFAQALSAGSVKIIDWKSIEFANMATVSFKEELLKTAAAMGTVVETGKGYYKTMEGKAVTATKNFRETLQDAWLTSDVLIETLKKYSSNEEEIGIKAQKAATEIKTFSMMVSTLKESLQTGWADTWELLIGNFEQAKVLWTAVTNELGGFIDKISGARNGLLKFWKDAGGREAFLRGFVQLWRNMKDILKAVQEGFRQVFPPLTGRALVTFSRKFEDLMKKLKPAPETLIKIRSAFAGFFSIFGIAKDAISAFRKAITPVIMKLLPRGANTILNASSSLGNMIVNLRKTIQEGKFFEKFFGRVASIFDALVRAGQKVFEIFKKMFTAFKTDGLTGAFKAMGEGFIDAVQSMWNFVKNLHIIQSIKDLGKRMADAIGAWPILEKFKEVVLKVRDWIVSTPVWKFCVSVVEGFVDMIQAAINKFKKVDTEPVGEFTENVEKKFSVWDKIKNFFKKIWSGIIAVFETVAPALKTVGTYIFGAFNNLFNGIVSVFKNSDLSDVGVLFAGGGLGMVLGSIGKFIANLGSTIAVGSRTMRAVSKSIVAFSSVLRAMADSIRAEALKKIAVSVAILAGALFVLAAIPDEKIVSATAAVMALFQGLNASMKAFNSNNNKDAYGASGAMLTAGVQIMMIASAVAVLVGALGILALMPYEPLVKGTVVLVMLLRAITREFINLKASEGSAVKMAGTMIAMAMAIRSIAITIAVLAFAIKKLDDPWVFIGSMVAIGLLIGFLGFVAASMNSIAVSRASVGPLVGMVLVINQLTLSIVAIALAAKFVGSSKVFDAVKILTLALLGAMGFILLLVAETAWLDKKEKQIRPTLFLSIAGAIIAMAAVIGTIALSILPLALIPAERLMNVGHVMTWLLLGLAGVLVGVGYIVGNASRASAEQHQLTGMVKTMMSMITIISLLAGSIIAIAFAAKMASKANTEGLEFIKFIMLELVTLILGVALVVGKVDHISRGVTKLAMVASMMTTAFMAFGLAVLSVALAFKILADLSGEEITRISDNLGGLARAITNNRHDLAQAIGGLIGTIIETVIMIFAHSSAAVVEGLMKMLNDAISVLAKNGPEIVDKLFTIVVMVLDGLTKRADEVVEKLVVTITKIISALADAIDKHKMEIIEAINKLINAVVDVFVGLFARLTGHTGPELKKFISEWRDAVKSFVLVAGGLFIIVKIITAFEKFGKVIGDIGHILADFGRSFITKFKAMNAATVEAGGCFKALKMHVSGTESGLGKLISSAKSLFGGHGLLVAGAGAAAIAFAKVLSIAIDKGTESIQTSTKEAMILSEKINELNRKNDEYNQTIADRKEKSKTFQDELVTMGDIKNRWDEIFDSSGKVKNGYEAQAKILAEDLSKSLGEEYTIHDGILTKINEQNEALQVQKSDLDELSAKHRLQQNIEVDEDAVKEAKKKLASGELAGTVVATSEAFEEQKKNLAQIAALEREQAKAQAEYDRTGDVVAFNRAQDLMNELNDMKIAYDTAEAAARQAQLEWDSAVNLVNNWDKAREILETGTVDQMNEMSTILENRINTALSNDADILEALTQFEKEVDAYNNMIELIDKGVEVPKETVKAKADTIKEYEKVFTEANIKFSSAGGENGKAYSIAFDEELNERIPKSRDQAIAGFTDPSNIKAFSECAIRDALAYIESFNGKNGFDQGSPSKKMYHSGLMAIAGFTNAVSDETSDAKRSMENTANAMMLAYNSAINDPKNTPTIVPMVDTSAIQNGSLMSSWNRTIDAGSVTARLAATVDTDTIVKANEATVNELVALRGDVQSLYDAFYNMQIVMDKNTVVGTIAPAMDAALGRRTVFKSKGV